MPLYWNWDDAAAPTATGYSDRTVYAYSVIPGGAQNREELQTALKRDPFAASHYGDFHADSVRVIRLAVARQVYVSYRIANRIYWTHKRISLRSGETLLTDGSHFARTRCGNRISETPEGSTSPSEPPAEALDRPVLPRPEFFPAGVPAASPLWPDGASPFLVALNPAGQPGPAGGAHPFVPLVPLIPCCGPVPSSEPKSPSSPSPSGPAPLPSPFPQPGPVPATPPVATPEPSSLMLLFVGLSGLLCLWAVRRA